MGRYDLEEMRSIRQKLPTSQNYYAFNKDKSVVALFDKDGKEIIISDTEYLLEEYLEWSLACKGNVDLVIRRAEEEGFIE